MITPDMVSEAIRTSHAACGGEKCIHQDALAGAAKSLSEDMVIITIGKDITYLVNLIYNHALHVGYRLHEIETTPTDPQKVN